MISLLYVFVWIIFLLCVDPQGGWCGRQGRLGISSREKATHTLVNSQQSSPPPHPPAPSCTSSWHGIKRISDTVSVGKKLLRKATCYLEAGKTLMASLKVCLPCVVLWHPRTEPFPASLSAASRVHGPGASPELGPDSLVAFFFSQIFPWTSNATNNLIGLIFTVL